MGSLDEVHACIKRNCGESCLHIDNPWYKLSPCGGEFRKEYIKHHGTEKWNEYLKTERCTCISY